MSYDWDKNVSKLKEKVSITDYVSKHVSLDKSGKGICPFHDDTNPSLAVHEKRGIFKCFSCGVGGDVIQFHKKLFNVSVKDSMEHLSKEYGVPIDAFNESNGISIDYSFTKYNDVAADFMSFRLFAHPDILEHIITTRNLSEETLRAYQVGICMNNAELRNVLKDKFPSASYNDVKELILPNGKPTFGGRIVFPLHNNSGNHVLGFSGRKLYADYDGTNILGYSDKPFSSDQEVAKYINSANSEIDYGYNKGSYLYGYHIAKAFGDIILMEGYYDVLSMYELGYKNTVAIGGTSLTVSQLSSLPNKDIVICLDFDKAGILATLDITKKFYYSNFNYGMFLVSTIEPVTDASEYLASRSKEGFKIGNFVEYINHVLSYYMPFYFDVKERYILYKAIVDTVNAMTASSGLNSFKASDIRMLILRHLHFHEPQLKEYVDDVLNKLYEVSQHGKPI
jgi:DNA primase